MYKSKPRRVGAKHGVSVKAGLWKSGLDRGLDCELDYEQIFGLDYGLSPALVTTISYHGYYLPVALLV